MKKTALLVLVALVVVSGCGRRLPVTAVPTDSPPGVGRQSVTKFADGQCVLNREVLVLGAVLNGQPTYERSTISGQPYPC